MLSGKAVSRAVRGFMMVDNALHILLMKESFGVSLPHTHESDITEADTSECDEVVEAPNFQFVPLSEICLEYLSYEPQRCCS
jgi:hypothetical protein